MADEETKKDESLSFKTADELTKYLMDLQGQIVNMQETIDKLQPVEEEAKEEGKEEAEESEEKMTDEDVSEIDKLLQSE